jgi:uncharacterized protein
LPLVAAGVLIVTGFYTASGRASADLSTVIAPRLENEWSLGLLLDLKDQPLPCCEP